MARESINLEEHALRNIVSRRQVNAVKKIVLLIITIFWFLACAYSMFGLFMVASLSGAPNYPPERAQFNANLWGSLTVLFFLLGALSAFVIWRTRKRRLT